MTINFLRCAFTDFPAGGLSVRPRVIGVSEDEVALLEAGKLDPLRASEIVQLLQFRLVSFAHGTVEGHA